MPARFGQTVAMTVCRSLGVLLDLLLAVPFFAGHSSLGPGTVSRDRFDYGRSIGESWKHQTLLNIVRLRCIKCSRKQPVDAFAAVSYNGYWFWVDDRDLKTKRAFSMLMLLFTLSDTGAHEPLPLITIPAQ